MTDLKGIIKQNKAKQWKNTLPVPDALQPIYSVVLRFALPSGPCHRKQLQSISDASFLSQKFYCFLLFICHFRLNNDVFPIHSNYLNNSVFLLFITTKWRKSLCILAWSANVQKSFERVRQILHIQFSSSEN